MTQPNHSLTSPATNANALKHTLTRRYLASVSRWLGKSLKSGPFPARDSGRGASLAFRSLMVSLCARLVWRERAAELLKQQAKAASDFPARIARQALVWLAADHRLPRRGGWPTFTCSPLVWQSLSSLSLTQRGAGEPLGVTLDQRRRKNRGAFYTSYQTSRELASALLASLPADARPQRVLDPACGTGVLLLAIAELLADRIPASEVSRALYGWDLDPVAVLLARVGLCEVLGAGDAALIARRVVWRDALLASRRARFDLLIANPPFANRIEGNVRRRHRIAMTGGDSMISGAADLSLAFMQLSDRLTRDGGCIALILPLVGLNSDTGTRLREHMAERRGVRTLLLPGKEAFSDATALVNASCVVLGGERRAETLIVDSRGETPRQSMAMVQGGNWWHPLHVQAGPQLMEKLGQHYEVVAGMTTGEAYRIQKLVCELEGPGVRLLTSGCIDPDRNLWGQRATRYLGSDYLRPGLPDTITTSLAPSLNRRLVRARRPKLIVAGLSARPEAVLDESGLYCGAVATWMIFDQMDRVERLRAVMEWLHSESVYHHFLAALGANALAGGNITLRKSWLLDLGIPAALAQNAEIERELESLAV